MAIVPGIRWLAMLTVLMIGCVPSHEYLSKTGKRIGVDRDYIKVLLIKNQTKVEITTTSKTKVTQLENDTIVYNGDPRRFVLYDHQIRQPMKFETWNNELTVNGMTVRGIIQLHSVVGKIQVVNVLMMNEYLYGVVPSEIPASWPPESLKAQAVAARTYAYYHIMRNNSTYFDLDASTNFQVYKGKSIESESTNRAVDATARIIMVYNNRPALAFFHSTCGGRISDDKHVWQGDDLPYLNSMNCTHCKNSPSYHWEVELSLNEIYEKLVKRHQSVGRIKAITLGREDSRVTVVRIEHGSGLLRMSGNDFRLMMDGKKIRSLNFDARQTSTGLMLKGNGWGHGVGMCQWGAKGMAEQGKRFDRILQFYYRGISLRSISNTPSSFLPHSK